MSQIEKPQRYQGVNHKGVLVTVVTGEPPKTMTIMSPDGSQKVIPYEERRVGKLTPVPRMPKDFTGFTDAKGNVL